MPREHAVDVTPLERVDDFLTRAWQRQVGCENARDDVSRVVDLLHTEIMGGSIAPGNLPHDGILQFTHIAWPPARFEARHELFGRATVRSAEDAPEMSCKHSDVARALAERRQLDARNRKSKKQI